MTRAAVALSGIQGITLDFGNTLVPVGHEALGAVVERTAALATDRLGLADPGTFLAAWGEERDRQFRENVPEFREVDLPQRVIRMLARFRGMAPPREGERWDDGAAAALSSSHEVATIVDSYSESFLEGIAVPPETGGVLGDLRRRGFRLAILSNWPLAITIDRYAGMAGWLPFLDGILVSQRIGTIKPHPRIFREAVAALGLPAGRILHVGDDWAADIVGAAGAGWRTGYLLDQQGDTPLPTSVRDGEVVPDLELHRLTDLPRHLVDPSP
jgi:HAD superfamily hydrolase (TIGR01509 family)